MIKLFCCQDGIGLCSCIIYHLFNPFRPKRPFLAPKLIISIKRLTDILFSNVLFLYVNSALQSCLKNVKIKKKLIKKNLEKIVLQTGWNGLGRSLPNFKSLQNFTSLQKCLTIDLTNEDKLDKFRQALCKALCKV